MTETNMLPGESAVQYYTRLNGPDATAVQSHPVEYYTVAYGLTVYTVECSDAATPAAAASRIARQPVTLYRVKHYRGEYARWKGETESGHPIAVSA